MIYLPFNQIQVNSWKQGVGLYHSSQIKETLSDGYMDERLTEEYEVDFFINGTAKLIIDNVLYIFEKNSICFRKPGQYNQQILDSSFSAYAFHFSVQKKDTGELLNFSDEYTHFFNKIPVYCIPENPVELEHVMNNYYSCGQISTESSMIHKHTLEVQLIQKLYSLVEEKETIYSFLHPAVKKAISYINLNIATYITVEEIASAVGLSPKHFQTIFKQSTGQTPLEYITEIRLNYAKNCLLTTELSIAEIAYLHGFSSCSYFNYVFKKHFNQTPGQFRKFPLNRQ